MNTLNAKSSTQTQRNFIKIVGVSCTAKTTSIVPTNVLKQCNKQVDRSILLLTHHFGLKFPKMTADNVMVLDTWSTAMVFRSKNTSSSLLLLMILSTKRQSKSSWTRTKSHHNLSSATLSPVLSYLYTQTSSNRLTLNSARTSTESKSPQTNKTLW